MEYVLSLVSRALQEQNPEYAHPCPAHKGPTINFVLEIPTAAPDTLTQPYPPPKGERGARGARGAKRLSHDGQDHKSSLYSLHPVARKWPP